MFAFGVLQAVQSAIPSAEIAYDATPFAYAGFLAFAALVGTVLGTVMRAQRTTHATPAPRLRPVPRAA